MSLKLKGTLLGILASFAGVALFVLLLVVVNVIAGVAGALTGMAFLMVYRKINPLDESKYPFILAIVITLVQVLIAALLAYAIWAAMIDSTLAIVLTNKDVLNEFILNLVIGYALSGGLLAYYLFSESRKRKNSAVISEEKKDDNKPE